MEFRIIKNKIRTAKRKHICNRCMFNIEIGHRYIYTVGIFEGSFGDFTECSKCAHLAKRVDNEI